LADIFLETEIKDMRKTSLLLLLALVLALPALTQAQGVNFSGTWKMDHIDPPVDPRNGHPPTAGGGLGGGGDTNNAYGASVRDLFAQAPPSLAITQTDSQITVQVGSETATYTMDDKLMVVPEGDVNGLKTHAHWDGKKLHLHFKKGMNWGRDILSMNDGKLVVMRDVESGGGSTTFTITYTKQ
jgi:hypothetical protein